MLGGKTRETARCRAASERYLGKTLHLKQPQGAAREVFGQSPGGPPHFWRPIPIRNRPCRYTSYYPLQSGDSHFGLPRPGDTTIGGAGGSGAPAINDQTLRKISVPFVPPKPNEFDIATSIFIFRALFAT